MTQKEKKNLITVVAIIAIGLAAYVGFGPLFDKFESGVTGQFLAALFGTVFTIMLTMFLLNKQTEIEEEKSRGESVFNERVELYKLIIDQMNDIVEDGEISITEMNKLQFMLVKLQMVAEDPTIKCFTKVYDAINDAFSRVPEEEIDDADSNTTKLEPNDKISILESMLEFSQSCRVELGLASSDNNNKELFKKTSESLKKSQKAVEEKKIGGARAEMNLGFREMMPELVKKSKYFDKNLFVKVETRGYPDPGRDFYCDIYTNDTSSFMLGAIRINPDKANPDKIILRYSNDPNLCRAIDELNNTKLGSIVEKYRIIFDNLMKKHSVLIAGKTFNQIKLTRDKARRKLMLDTNTEFNVSDLNSLDVVQKIVDYMLENGIEINKFKLELDEELKKLGTSLNSLYADSRKGMPNLKEEGEED